MLELGSFRCGTCSGVTRRAFLHAAAALPFVGTRLAKAAQSDSLPRRAHSVIFVWLWGAPSHLDTFDPKPAAPLEYRGPFTPIATRTPGLLVTELLPRLAARSDRYTVVRSNVTSEPGHPDAGTVGLTGFKERPAPVHPSFGAIVGRHRGQRGDRSRSLPPFVALGAGVPRDVVRIVEGYGGGKWGRAHDPFMISCSPEGAVEIPALRLLDGLTPLQLADRRTLLSHVDAAQRAVDAAHASDWERSFSQAYGLLTQPEARRAFDLSRETPATRAAYGQTAFGQSCLLARRLVEAQTPFIQVNWSEYVECMTPHCDFGWDTHIYNFELLQDRHCPIFDRSFAALLDDLHQRGLLETTLVVAMGEFGRTPRINGRASRDHWPRCYFSLWAGAGIAGGRVVGASDPRGEDPVTTAITPLMVGTTLAQLAGVDAQARAELRVLDGGTVIDELV